MVGAGEDAGPQPPRACRAALPRPGPRPSRRAALPAEEPPPPAVRAAPPAELHRVLSTPPATASAPISCSSSAWASTLACCPAQTPLSTGTALPCSGVAKMRSFVLAKLRIAKIPAAALGVIERSEVVSSPLRFRSPLALVRGSISRGGVCVVGDALHPMTPEIGQGGCAAHEDGVILATRRSRRRWGGTPRRGGGSPAGAGQERRGGAGRWRWRGRGQGTRGGSDSKGGVRE
ncbi:hypothetical protein PVAP13_1NG194038 [Panicum virgatum]|uniref:FAD-binding domain-containing protein n=1 Tax=Panicum virgatum TaxID=38727 RepID=A0A8T0WSU5_PANVG|nr:hypothetical protein PVAP13_1NG194038 [Panicum virgatum]